MKPLAVTLLIVLVVPLALSQTAPPAPKTAPPNPEEMLEHWRRATVALGVVVMDGKTNKFVTVGSAVIISLDANRGALLTAKHILSNPETGQITRSLWMRFPSIAGKNEEPIQLTLFDPQGNNIWRASADGADLAVIPIPEGARKRERIDAVFVSDFADPKNDIFQGATVLVLGYPQIVGEEYSITPTARGGIIAWTNPGDPANQQFLVDANLYNGNSGGPVFRIRNGLDRYGTLNLGGGIAFLGIVSRGPLQYAPVVSEGGMVYHQNPITGAQNPEFAIVANVGGIGIVEPASRARKLIEEVFANIPAPTKPPH